LRGWISGLLTSTTKLRVKDGFDSLANEENTGQIVKSAKEADKVIITWGKLGENNKKVRDMQDKLLESLKPFKDKLFVISDNVVNEGGFHPLAPQIRFVWVLKKFEPVAKKPGKQGEKKETPTNE
jgi:hypothetical protein